MLRLNKPECSTQKKSCSLDTLNLPIPTPKTQIRDSQIPSWTKHGRAQPSSAPTLAGRRGSFSSTVALSSLNGLGFGVSVEEANGHSWASLGITLRIFWWSQSLLLLLCLHDTRIATVFLLLQIAGVPNSKRDRGFRMRNV